MNVVRIKCLSMAEVRLRDDGILEHRLQDGCVLTRALAHEILAASLSMVSRRVPVLVSMKRLHHVERDARTLLSTGYEVKHLTNRVAMVVSSAVSRTVATFFVAVHRPPFPTQVFSSDERAVEWLLSGPS